MFQSTPRREWTESVCHVIDAGHIVCIQGVNRGDRLGSADDLCLGDVYEVSANATATVLSTRLDARDSAAGTSSLCHVVSPDSETGSPGDIVTIEARLTFMGADGSTAEALLLAVADGLAPKLLPLSPIGPRVGYTLIQCDAAPAAARLADALAPALGRGTAIAMADGTQRPVESLVAGDLVLTRDNGPQPVRQVLTGTVRALGQFAPIVVAPGALGNARPLVLGQQQRVYVYGGGASGGRGARSALLVSVGDLADDERIARRPGGFFDYIGLVFDRHEVIYAECVPTESILVNDDTVGRLLPWARALLEDGVPGLSHEPVRAEQPVGARAAALRPRLLRAV